MLRTNTGLPFVRCCKEEPSLKGTIVNHLGVLIIPRRRRREGETETMRGVAEKTLKEIAIETDRLTAQTRLPDLVFGKDQMCIGDIEGRAVGAARPVPNPLCYTPPTQLSPNPRHSRSVFPVSSRAPAGRRRQHRARVSSPPTRTPGCGGSGRGGPARELQHSFPPTKACSRPTRRRCDPYPGKERGLGDGAWGRAPWGRAGLGRSKRMPSSRRPVPPPPRTRTGCASWPASRRALVAPPRGPRPGWTEW